MTNPDYIKATTEAELGFSTCRICKKQGKLEDFLTIMYGNGLAYATCIGCLEVGYTLLIKRGPFGIEVLRQKL